MPIRTPSILPSNGFRRSIVFWGTAILNYEIRAAFLRVVIARNYLLPTLGKIGPPRFRRLMLTLIPWKALQEVKEISDTMHKTSLEIFESKKRAFLEGDAAVVKQIGQGKDIMSILRKTLI